MILNLKSKISNFKLLVLVILLIVILLEIRNSKLEIGTVNAQVPANTNISCGNVSDTEFNSLRPYQANTQCTSQTASEATFCGNNLTLKETIEKTYTGGGGNCTTKGSKVYCTYNVSVPSHKVTIDLSGADLPFMGNTEDALSDADKMNDYVSWYLGGVTNKKEYPDKSDDDSLVNFSGPLAKLLPLEIQNANRFTQIKNAKVTRHDQVVVCTKKEINSSLIPSFLKWGLENLGVGQTVATDCPGEEKWRLTNWDGNLSIVNTLQNAGISLLDLFLNTFPSIPGDIITQALDQNKAWPYRVPPLSWGVDPSGKPFDSLTYQKAYKEWQGNSCIITPFPKILLCLNNILISNEYSDLFSYIPLSSTEDVEGNISIDQVSSAQGTSDSNVIVKNIAFSNQNPATLFFSHMEESDQLSSLLQDTYAPKGEGKVGSPTNVASETSCNTVEVRSNKGDDLFATQLTGDLSYTANFSCTFDAPVPTGCYERCTYFGGAPNECRADCLYPDASPISVPTPTQECKKDVYINLSTTSKIPLADDIWSRLVAGPMAVFKRIFPKTNTAGSVGQIMDMPGSTNINYSGTNVSQSNTDLKLPHLGGISEYFLNGIQTALRPKGLGDAISFAPNSDEDSSSSGEINCNQTIPEIAVNGLNKTEAENITKIWYATGPGRPYFKECNNDVIQRSKNKNIDPIFTLAIWIHESDASNYEAVNYPVEDFGIHGNQSVPTNNFSKQLDFFLNLPSSYAAKCGKKDMNTFISMFWFGHCSPINQNEKDKISSYTNDLNFIYSVIAPGIALPNYPN